MIEIKNLCKSYGAKKVFDDFNLTLPNGKIIAILGESGAGKTTLLNCIANLTDYEGEIIGETNPISYVFREDRLIPNLTVKQNLELVCKDCDIDSALDSVGLLNEKDNYPKNLSAGMAKRVSLLRALVFNSNLLVLDEPFNNLDLALKYSLIEMVKDMQKTSPRTVLAVTHDVKEAVTIADRIVVISHGKIVFDCDNITKDTEDILFNFMLSLGSKD